VEELDACYSGVIGDAHNGELHDILGAFRVTKLRQNSAKMDFSKHNQNKKVLAKHCQNSCFAIGPTEPQHDQNTFPKLIQNLAFPFF